MKLQKRGIILTAISVFCLLNMPISFLESYYKNKEDIQNVIKVLPHLHNVDKEVIKKRLENIEEIARSNIQRLIAINKERLGPSNFIRKEIYKTLTKEQYKIIPYVPGNLNVIDMMQEDETECYESESSFDASVACARELNEEVLAVVQDALKEVGKK